MMVHLEHAASTSRAMMRTIWLPGVTLFAKTCLAGRLDREGWNISARRKLMGRKIGVPCCTAGIERRARIGEDGSGV